MITADRKTFVNTFSSEFNSFYFRCTQFDVYQVEIPKEMRNHYNSHKRIMKLSHERR